MKRSPLRKLKDSALERAVLIFARSKFERYGELKWVEIDTANKLLRAEVLLKGETDPVTVQQARYHFQNDGKRKMLVLHDFKISKEWIQNLVEDRFPEFPITVPAFIGSLLS